MVVRGQRLVFWAFAAGLCGWACSDDDPRGAAGAGGSSGIDAANSGGGTVAGGSAVGGIGGLDGGAGDAAGGSDGGAGDAAGGSDGGAAAGSGGDAAGGGAGEAAGGGAGETPDAGSADGDVLDADSDALDADSEDSSIDAFACVPGDRTCHDDDLFECNPTGTLFVKIASCEAGLCDADAAACLECAVAEDCAPTNECLDPTCTSSVCGSTPKSAGAPCGNDGVCTGAGVCGECLPGSVACNGDVPVTCDANFVWQTGSACGGSTPECDAGSCKPATGPSCGTLQKSCGATGDRSCCALDAVSAGSFSRSYDAVSYANASWTATISEFWLDRYEVSVGRFRRFVQSGKSTQANPPVAGSGAHPAIASSGWNSAWSSSLASNEVALRAALACDAVFATWTDAPSSNENRPITCVTWFEAFAFCAWDGGRLPTEAEWNRAAAGGSEQRVYPWSSPPGSSAITDLHASYWVNATEACMGDGVAGCALSDILPVGHKPLGHGRWGHADLSGNVWEWTLDVYVNPYAQVPCNDCAALSGSSQRVLRGGSFFANPSTVLSSKRHFGMPADRYFSAGVRCARNQ
jgi:formylglycine-generating enzyme